MSKKKPRQTQQSKADTKQISSHIGLPGGSEVEFSAVCLDMNARSSRSNQICQNSRLTPRKESSIVSASNTNEQGNVLMETATPGEAGIAWIMSMIPERNRGGFSVEEPKKIMQHVIRRQEKRLEKVKIARQTSRQSPAVSAPDVGNPS